MLIFGHLGLTIGIAWLIKVVFSLKKVDYKLVALGSLLPDIIDKPLGMIILPLNNGRIIAHTLLFNVILLLICLKYKKQWLAFGSFLHLIEDRMWKDIETLFWPLFGFKFPVGEEMSFYDYLIKLLMTGYMPSLSFTFLSELFGLIILIIFFIININIIIKNK